MKQFHQGGLNLAAHDYSAIERGGAAWGQALSRIGDIAMETATKYDEKKKEKQKKASLAKIVKGTLKNQPGVAKRMGVENINDEAKLDAVSNAIADAPEGMQMFEKFQSEQRQSEMFKLNKSITGLREELIKKTQPKTIARTNIESDVAIGEGQTAQEKLNQQGGPSGAAQRQIKAEDVTQKAAKTDLASRKLALAGQQRKEKIAEAVHEGMGGTGGAVERAKRAQVMKEATDYETYLGKKRTNEEMERAAAFNKKAEPFRLDNIRNQSTLSELQVDQIKQKQNVNRILAGEQGAWTATEMDMAEQERIKRKRAEKQFKQDFKKGKFEIRRLDSLIKSAGDAGTSQQERILKFLKKGKHITEEEAIEIQKGWLMQNAGLEGLNDRQKYEYLGESMGAGTLNLKGVSQLLNASETGDQINQKSVTRRTDRKTGKDYLEYYNDDGKKNKVYLTEELEDRVKVYRNFWGGDLQREGQSTDGTGTTGAQPEQKPEQVVVDMSDEEIDSTFDY